MGPQGEWKKTGLITLDHVGENRQNLTVKIQAAAVLALSQLGRTPQLTPKRHAMECRWFFSYR